MSKYKLTFRKSYVKKLYQTLIISLENFKQKELNAFKENVIKLKFIIDLPNIKLSNI